MWYIGYGEVSIMMKMESSSIITKSKNRFIVIVIYEGVTRADLDLKTAIRWKFKGMSVFIRSITGHTVPHRASYWTN